jgi:hypothetical protein
MAKFSIVIPTVDRHYLLEHTLRSYLMMDRSDFEVIVSDNFSSSATKAVVDAHRHDGRLKYYRTDRRMPMPEHWDFAWSKASGRYVLINCDDDGLSASGLVQIDRAIETLNPQILSWPIALYYHPDYDDEDGANSLVFPSGHSNFNLLLDSLRIAQRYDSFNFQYFPEGTHFCIAKDLGDRIVRETGHLFWPLAPDFTAPLLGLATGARYCYIDAILGFGGRSKSSNAASYSKTCRGSGRIQQFHSEFQGRDPYPHHPCKANLYCNYLFAATSLVRKFYPGVMPGKPDMYQFFCLAQQELLGFRPSPMIDDEARRLFDDYVAGLDLERQQIAEKARGRVMKSRGKERSASEIARAITPRIVMTGIERILAAMGLYKRTASVVKITGDKCGFASAFEVLVNWDRIVADHEITSLANVDGAFKAGLILSAYRQA